MSDAAIAWYVPTPDGQPSGPHSTDVIVAACRQGQYTPETLCWRDGYAEWVPLGQIEEFRDLFTASRSELGDLGKGLGRMFDATKKKARGAAVWMAIRRHEKQREHILLELGRLFCESGGELLTQAPYAEVTRRVRAEEQSLAELRTQLDELWRPTPPDGAGGVP